jgi:hypothetical protein
VAEQVLIFCKEQKMLLNITLKTADHTLNEDNYKNEEIRY